MFNPIGVDSPVIKDVGNYSTSGVVKTWRFLA